MNKKVIGFLVIVMVGILMLSIIALPAMANNSKPNKADGVWCYIPAGGHFYPFAVPQPVPPDGAPIPQYPEQLFNAFWETSQWSGTFKGDAMDIGWGVFQTTSAPAYIPTYPTLFEAVVTFEEVKVKGRTGGLELDVGGYKAFGLSDWVGSWQVRPGSGTGELEGLEGYGTLRGPGFQPDNSTECGKIYYFVEKLKFTKFGD